MVLCELVVFPWRTYTSCRPSMTIIRYQSGEEPKYPRMEYKVQRYKDSYVPVPRDLMSFVTFRDLEIPNTNFGANFVELNLGAHVSCATRYTWTSDLPCLR